MKRTKTIPYYVSLLLFAVISLEIHAINLDFQAMVDRREIDQDEDITITIQVSGENLKEKLPFPTVDESSDFKLLNKNSRQSTSQNISVINGRMTRSNITTTSFEFSFRPLRSGDLKLPGFNFEYMDFKRRIGATDIRVHKISSESGQGSGEINLFLKFANTTLFVNEQTALTATIRKRADAPIGGINQPEIEKILSKNFWVKPLGTEKWKEKRVDINGVQYQEFSQNYAVFPIMEGAVTVPSIELKYSVVERRQQRRGADPFNDPFFGSFFESTTTKEKSKYSPSVNLTVLSLPQNGKPKDFGGAVGQFKLSATVDKTELKAGEALNLKVSVTGKGNEKSISSVVIRKRERFEVFDPEVNSSAEVRNGSVMASKTFRFVMIPQVEGKQEIGPIILYFFDPEKKQYDSISTSINISVAKGEGVGSGRNASYISKSDIRILGNDIRYIKTESRNLRDETDRFDKSILFVLLLASPLAFTIAFLFYKKQSIKVLTDIEYARNRRAKRVAEKTLKDAQNLLLKKSRAFDDAVHKAIAGFIADKINLPSGSMTTEEIMNAIKSKTFKNPSLVTEIQSFLEQCDFHRFTMVDVSTDEKEDRLKKAKILVERLLREWQ